VVLRRLAHHKGEDGASIRWFAEYDASVQALRHRHSRMLLADLVVIMQGASPFNAAVDFGDDLSEVFRKAGQSMQAACHVLRDESLFQVISVFQSTTPIHWIPTTESAHTPIHPPSASTHPHAQTHTLMRTQPHHTTSTDLQLPASPRSCGSARTCSPATGWITAFASSRTGAARARSRSASRPGSVGQLLTGFRSSTTWSGSSVARTLACRSGASSGQLPQQPHRLHRPLSQPHRLHRPRSPLSKRKPWLQIPRNFQIHLWLQRAPHRPPEWMSFCWQQWRLCPALFAACKLADCVFGRAGCTAWSSF
jgi:hypothetical protein